MDLFSAAAARLAPQSPASCDKCYGSGRFHSHHGRDCGECFTCRGTGLQTVRAAPAALATVDVDRLMTCFESASKSGLKRPAMRFEGWQASLAPATGKNPGAVYCKADGLYLGKIVAGQFFGSRDCTQANRASIVAAMADPLASAIAYGRRTGACSCCGRPLCDPKSVALGIGPVCKSKYGL